MNKGVFLSVLGVLAAMLALAGCGGGDDDTTASVTRAEFVKQANALCQKGTEERNQQFKAAAQKIKPGETFTDADREELVLDILLPPYEETIEGLKALSPPEGDEQKIEEIIQAMEKTAQTIEENPGPAIQSTSQFKEPSTLSAKYGLTACVV